MHPRTRAHTHTQETSTPGLRPMEARDVAQVHVLLNGYLAQFKFTPVFSLEDVAHYFLPVAETVFSYVGVVGVSARVCV